MAKAIQDDQDFLATARQRYEFGKDADKVDRTVAEDDNRFAHADDVNLEQWDKKAKAARKKRPVLQWNRIPTYIQQVANDGRQNKPSIKISRGDEAATQVTAEFLTARIRQIEYESNVDTAKDCARDQQVTTGRGFLRVSTEWIPGTQKQRICVDKIENQFSVVWDPAARKYDRSDADWCFVISTISNDEHLRKFGPDSLVAHMDFAHIDKDYQDWIGIGQSGEMIQVAEYWHKEWNTQVVPAGDGQLERTEKVATVVQSFIDGAQVHSETEWLGSTIPIVPQWGHESVVDGARRTFSLIRNAKEPQRLANLFLSNMAEQIGQMPKTPYLMPVGGIAANHEGDWANALNTPLAYLYYQVYDANGRQLPQPSRVANEPPVQALIEGLNHCFDGIKAAMGIFDASMGAKSNETSGIAIQRRKKESDVSNFHFPDNEARTNKYLGEILIELIKQLDRPGSSVPIRSADGKTHIVPIGQEHQDWQTGQMVTHDLLSGQYGVTVSSGPGYETARQEKEDRDIALVQSNSEMLYAIGGSMLRSDDSAGSDERADAWEQYVSLKMPGMKFGKPGQGQPDPQAMQQAQQQMQQMGQKLQTTEAFAQQLHQQIQTKQQEGQLAIQLKEMQLAFDREKLASDDQNAKLKIASVEGIAELEQQISILMAERSQAHQTNQAQMGQQHAMGMQQGSQDHAMGMQAGAQDAAAQAQQQQEQAESAQQQQGEVEQPTEGQEAA
jgi:hypothetical protein